MRACVRACVRACAALDRHQEAIIDSGNSFLMVPYFTFDTINNYVLAYCATAGNNCGTRTWLKLQTATARRVRCGPVSVAHRATHV